MAESATANGSNLGALTIAIAVVSMVLCTTGVVSRLFTRLNGAGAYQSLYLEDWLLVGPAYICTMGVACTMIVATTYKLGSHVDRAVDTDDIIRLMKTLYAVQIVLLIALGSIRASLLLFIKRLSKTSSEPIYQITSCLVHVSTAHITVSIFSSIFRCNPISTVWTLKAVTYTCSSLIAVYILVAVGFAIDAAMFALPAILIISLNITKKKKLQSLVMFALGGAGCIIEALRFGQLQETKKSPDPIYHSGKIVIFLFIQVVLGMLCCCAPAIKAFGAKVIDARFGRTKNFGSYSDYARNSATHDSSRTRDRIEDIESGGDPQFRKVSSLSQRSWAPRAESIEMIIQGAESEHNGEDKTTVVERIMDPEAVLRFSSERRGS